MTLQFTSVHILSQIDVLAQTEIDGIKLVHEFVAFRSFFNKAPTASVFFKSELLCQSLFNGVTLFLQLFLFCPG